MNNKNGSYIWIGINKENFEVEGQEFSEKGKESIEQALLKAKLKIKNISEEIKLDFLPAVNSPYGEFASNKGQEKGRYVVRIELTPSHLKGCYYIYG